MTDANDDALRYQLRIHDIEYSEHTDVEHDVTFYVVSADMPAALVEQIGACGFGIMNPGGKGEKQRCIIAPDAAVGGGCIIAPDAAVGGAD